MIYDINELLKRITERCGKTKHCRDGCPFFDPNTGVCVFEDYPADWNVDLISEKINEF